MKEAPINLFDCVARYLGDDFLIRFIRATILLLIDVNGLSRYLCLEIYKSKA